MRADRDDDEGFEVPLTPLIDIVFLLLIFFLVATTFARTEIDQKVKLPESEGGEKQRNEPENLVINIRSDGTLVIAGRVVEPDRLRLTVEAWKEENPDRRVAIRGDADVPYREVARVMGVCKSVGVTDVDLPVEEPSPEG